MSFDITPYLPSKEELDPEVVAGVLARLRIQSKAFFPDVKTTPNSPFGSLHLQPLATLIAQYEQAMDNFTSDLLLENVAAGTVYNCDFVKSYLKNFGVAPGAEVPVIGTVRLTFQENKTHVLNRGSQILFGETGLFHFIAPQLGDIIIDPVGFPPKPGNWHALQQTGEFEYVVNLSVIGPSGIEVEAGDTATTDIPDADLASIVAVQTFDTGRMPDTLPALAQMALDIHYAANFSERGGTLAFVKRKLPNIVGVSPIKTGDIEMQRDKESILGIATGKMDVLVKGSQPLPIDTARLTLSRSMSGKFVGAIRVAGGSPVYIDDVRVAGSEQSVDNFKIYTTSKDQVRAKLASSAFSELEILGLEVTSSSSVVQSGSEFSIRKNAPAATYPRIDAATSGGIYRGHLFGSQVEQDLVLKTNGINVIDGVQYGILDITNRATGQVIRDVLVSRDSIKKRGVIDFNINKAEVQYMFNGVDIQFETSLDDFVLTSPSDFSGQEFRIFFRAPAVPFDVYYRYDPAQQQLSDLIKSPEVQPVTDVLVKGFNTCFIENLTISYRRKSGVVVNKANIIAELLTYFNSLTYPNVYEESVISDIILYGKASGLVSVEATATVYHSLGEKVSTDGKDDIPNFSTLLSKNVLRFNDIYEEPEFNSIVYQRNIHYVLDEANIVLKEVN
jgi:hypothetical protein